jgi:hypothetical protein
LFVLFLPIEFNILACEVNERSGERGIVVDPYAHGSRGAEKCTDIGNSFARWPGADLGYL